MPFSKNDPNINRNGRPKGSPNKITEEIREAYAMVLENRLPDLDRWIMQVSHEDPAKAADLLMKLSERFLPALQRQEITAADGEDLFKNVKFNFGTPSEEEDNNSDIDNFDINNVNDNH